MRALITADIHFNVKNRLDDFYNSVKFLAEECVRRECDVFVIVGDGYHSNRPYPIEMDKMHKIVTYLIANNKQVLILVGNHDYVESDEFEGVHCFSELKSLVDSEKVLVIDSPCLVTIGNVIFLCIPHIRESLYRQSGISHTAMFENILVQLLQKASETKDKMQEGKSFNILLSHVFIQGARVGNCDLQIESSRQVSAGVFENEKIDGRLAAGFLGDIHLPQLVHESPPILYVGSPDRVDFGEKNDPKGAVFLDTNGEALHYEFVRTPARNFYEIVFDLTKEQEDGVDIKTRLITEILRHGKALTNSIVKVSVMCTEETKRSVDEQEVMQWLQGQGIHQVKSWVYDIQRSDQVRDKQFTESLAPVNALEIWSKKQSYTEAVQQIILASGRKIING